MGEWGVKSFARDQVINVHAVWWSLSCAGLHVYHLCISAQFCVASKPQTVSQLSVQLRKNGTWLMEQYVFHPALLPHMSNHEQAELSAWWTEKKMVGACKARKCVNGSFMPPSAAVLTCFPDLMYVNSTCKLRDKDFNTGNCNFMAYLLWKYFHCKSNSFPGWILLLCTGGDFAEQPYRLSDCSKPQWETPTFSHMNLLYINLKVNRSNSKKNSDDNGLLRLSSNKPWWIINNNLLEFTVNTCDMSGTQGLIIAEEHSVRR